MKTLCSCFRAFSIICVAVAATGCATLKPKVSVSSFGDVNIQRDKEISVKAKTITDTADVKVISGAMPEGLSLQEQSSKLVILPGYESKYSIIGSVDGDYVKAMTYFEFLWYPELGYDGDWRETLCHPQAPINVMTLGIWSVFSPTAWACNRKIPSDENDRKAGLIEQLKKGVKAAGGNLLIITAESSLTVTRVNKYGDHLGSTVSPSMGMQGFIVKEN